MKKVTIHTLQKMKDAGERVSMLTCYDATFARLFDAAGLDVLLVGDSLGMVVQGHPHTLPVTVDDVVYHCRAVARATKRAHLVADMPFGSYQVSGEEAVRHAIRLVAEGGAESVKLEGGADFVPVVEAIVRASVPVMGHLGLTPQSFHKLGGYVVQGRGENKARRLVEDAIALEKAGCYAIVLEAIPAELAAEVTAKLSIPTIGIGAGAACSGQVLVCYDMLGLDPDFKPRFVKRFAELGTEAKQAAERYVSEVRGGAFPAAAHAFPAEEIRLVKGHGGTGGD
ncbi:MAG TPA: 3-methyl-2-oxobutanoate hydroxymethyltransferase [Myxococcales bacterium]|nr:3-methyl-2-oxobutanoate hydroxymethyltransferase [Myxococcales bacterium]